MRDQLARYAEPEQAATARVDYSAAKHARSDRRTACNSRCHPCHSPCAHLTHPAVRMLARNHFGIFTEPRRRTTVLRAQLLSYARCLPDERGMNGVTVLLKRNDTAAGDAAARPCVAKVSGYGGFPFPQPGQSFLSLRGIRSLNGVRAPYHLITSRQRCG